MYQLDDNKGNNINNTNHNSNKFKKDDVSVTITILCRRIYQLSV